eukprot:361427-Chlamydomonas_euryale.AAC.8
MTWAPMRCVAAELGAAISRGGRRGLGTCECRGGGCSCSKEGVGRAQAPVRCMVGLGTVGCPYYTSRVALELRDPQQHCAGLLGRQIE